MKSFGFPIHAAEDGYSRKVLWVKTEMSNNLPEVQVITYNVLGSMVSSLWKPEQIVALKMAL